MPTCQVVLIAITTTFESAVLRPARHPPRGHNRTPLLAARGELPQQSRLADPRLTMGRFPVTLVRIVSLLQERPHTVEARSYSQTS